ncbi:hypothetical protein [Streptomyces sp. NPDC054786]
MSDSLPDRLAGLADAAIAVLDTSVDPGWSPFRAGDALTVIDVLTVALAKHGGLLTDACAPDGECWLGRCTGHLVAENAPAARSNTC